MMKILVGAVAMVLAGCAAAPVNVAPASPCSFLRFEQAGKQVAPVAGTVTLARAPFTIAYVGPGREPGLHAARKPELGAALTQHGRGEVWIPFGQGMAGSPGELFTDDKIEVFRDQGSRKAVNELVHSDYWPMVREKVEASPLDVGVRAGLNVRWEPAVAGAPRVYRVRSIDEVAVERSRLSALHLVAFAETDRVVAQRVSIPMLARARWNACSVRFQ